jgi:hypothetical protein
MSEPALPWFRLCRTTPFAAAEVAAPWAANYPHGMASDWCRARFPFPSRPQCVTGSVYLSISPRTNEQLTLTIEQAGYSSVGRASDCRSLQLSDGPWFDSGWPDLSSMGARSLCPRKQIQSMLLLYLMLSRATCSMYIFEKGCNGQVQSSACSVSPNSCGILI